MDGKNGTIKVEEVPTMEVPTVGRTGVSSHSQELFLQQGPPIHQNYTSIVGGVLATIALNGGTTGLAKVSPDGIVSFFISWN